MMKRREMKTENQRLPEVKFLSMNYDCISSVLENLSLSELCIMAKVSVQTKQLARSYFRTKYATFNMGLLAHGEEKITLAQAECFLHTFGNLITNLYVCAIDFVFDQPRGITRADEAKKLFDLIRKYCSLELLTLDQFITDLRWEMVQPIWN